MPQKQFSIETGYFIFTMMPSLRCSLNCPHCYLTKEQRRSSEIMTIERLESACVKVRDYYQGRKLPKAIIQTYWYGGEPTEMPKVGDLSYVEAAALMMKKILPEKDGFEVRHTVLTSLVTVNLDEWLPVFNRISGGHFQTSFDGLMRGGNYVKRWEARVKEALRRGNSVGTISVVNHEMLHDDPAVLMDYLSDLGVKESSFLPFMLNDANIGEKYKKYAPTMSAWNDFMIGLTERYFERQEKGLFVTEPGQMHFINHQASRPGREANIASQTLFLMPNGDFSLPDYYNGFQEYLRPFGNIFEQSFDEVLKSKPRKAYIQRQVMVNNNSDCLDCQHKDKCVMEFWKPNRDGDECFGGRRYIDWLINPKQSNRIRCNHDQLELY